ncbi:MAG: DUF2017 domain-containing protein [Actinomycetota bacterium]|nr:DUF2017 domain-containing protein [Actinomycetota bacterium]
MRLTRSEHAVLRAVAEELEPVLAGRQDVAGATQRLYPRAYDDDGAEAEYRDLVGDDLVGERLAALATFARTLDATSPARLGWGIDLDADEAAAWLATVNDARLVLGCALGITDERAWDEGPHTANPASVALHYLGWLQEQLLAALATTLPTP